MKAYGLIIGAVVGIGLFLVAPFLLRIFDQKSLPVHGKVIEFSVTDSLSKSFGTNQLRGKVWVADFIFTSCPGQCPMMTQALAKVYRSYLLENDVAFVSFTVDPERDTPEVLQKYADTYKIDTSKWHFLTAPIETIHKISIEGFKLGTVENPLFHNERFILVDRELNVRGYYDANSAADLKKLFGDLASVLDEKKSRDNK